MIRFLTLELLGMYKALRPLLGPARCRFYPSCSEYARQAIVERGVLRALPMIASRLLRCHPFHPGGFDPVHPVTHG